MLNALQIPVEEFLRPFYDPDDTICLRVFDDRKAGIFKGQKLETTLTSIGNLLPLLHRHNAQNRGIFYVINTGGHEDTDITKINAQFVECDDLSLDEQWEHLQAFKLPPSIIVKTRKSLHAYWLMRDARVEDFRRVQKELIAQFQGDKACTNESRLLRLPGFYHCKEEPIMVECVKFSPELRYTQAELEAVLPKVDGEPTPIKSLDAMVKGTRQGLALVERRCDFIKHCREQATTLPEVDWYAMITNLAVFEGGDELIHELSAPYPGYSHDETQDKIEHFRESRTKPITCQTIAEKGFECPHLADGKCACKSPAALCYCAATLDVLRSLMLEITPSTDAMMNIQSAEKFISAYMYNISPVIAASFIQRELGKSLMLKAQETKPLCQQQRSQYKAWSTHKDTKQAKHGADFPEWYEPTDKGGMNFFPGLLADHLSKNFPAFYSTGAYYAYENGVYRIRDDLWATATLRERLIARYSTYNAICDATQQWRMLIQKPLRDINSNAYILNLRNGLYNVLEGTFKPHTPEYLSTVQLNASYVEGAQAPQFMEFLQSVLDEPEILLLKQIFGYLLLPINKAQKSFVLVGAANAGKSTLLTVVQEILLGNENVSNIPWQNLSDRFNKAELFGKLANIFADLPSKAIDDNGMFKALTGDDSIMGERKGKNPFSFRPHARFLFSCNDIPRNYGDRSDGFYRRLILIRFTRSVPPEKRDPNLVEKLKAEKDGILMWALEGLKELIKANYVFRETDATKAELEKYRVESNSVLSFFAEYCAVDEKQFVIRDTLYQHYKEFCGNSGLRPITQIAFNRDMEANAPTLRRSRDKASGCRVWRGLAYLEQGNGVDL